VSGADDTPVPAVVPAAAAGGAPVRSADQKHCFSCGRLLHVSAQTCPTCGAIQPALGAMAEPSFAPAAATALPAHAVFCRGCGAPIHATARTCPRCGAPQAVATAAPRHDRATAALLAILLGSFGAHKFYLGRTGWGVVYLLFFWTLVPAILGLIEGFIYLCQSDEDFARAYR
jgi:TM2 domain-containing membrane protein YozV/RNA polymerase subunit RPABC4/transcription elongation factor Spt4